MRIKNRKKHGKTCDFENFVRAKTAINTGLRLNKVLIPLAIFKIL